jgi:hypothetical protein
MPYEEWNGPRPPRRDDGSEPDLAAYYRPEWPADAVMGWCVYATVNEGSPVTPVFASREELVEHLVEHGTQELGRQIDAPFSRAAAERFVFEDGYVSSLVSEGGVVRTGAEDLEHRVAGS